ncbi:DMT family transporter [Sulfitobacter aestuariivivens]|uniref:DMT family transporter n=1 Tax=Sulfitobacter aestuariivivens TaxID=2766981 RepID=A0A927D942_9RHOB|nr:DMT family transporter [Sulfitobacter aestuariivivens]MBD3665897.1 DMT family transporter [Sulfitobacter aestuariivivens]
MQRAILIMFVAMSLIPAGDSAGKLLSGGQGVAPVFVAWSRFALGTLLVLPFLKTGMGPLFRDWRIWARAIILAGGITSIQTALQTADVATVFAAFFVGPIFSYVLAAIFLREPITGLRTLMILLGFAGVLVVVRPGMGGDPGVIWALIAGLFYGAFLTMSRWVSGVATPMALTFSQLSIAAVILLPWGLMHFPPVTRDIAALTVASALFSAMGNLLLLYAYRLAPATRLAPLIYLQLLAAVLLGWWIFGDLPDVYTWAGLGLILGAGLISTRLR